MKLRHLLAAGAIIPIFAGTSVALAGPAPATKVNVAEKEMTVNPSQAGVRSGKVTLVIHNRGTVEHELVVMREPSSGRLKVTHFKADEATIVDEAEELAPGELAIQQRAVRRRELLDRPPALGVKRSSHQLLAAAPLPQDHDRRRERRQPNDVREQRLHGGALVRAVPTVVDQGKNGPPLEPMGYNAAP